MHLLILLLLNINARGADTSAEELFEKAKAYTVKIKASVLLPFREDTKGTWSGAGFIIDAQKKWVVTNAHVTSHSNAILQASSFGQELAPAKAIYVDPYFDIAIIQIASFKNLQNAPLDCASLPATGVAVGAFGHPENYNYTGTKGIISGRTADLGIFGDYLQTDAPINPGNSGGPLINMASGKVVGMNTAGRDKAQNMNWAVPAEQICSIYELLKKAVDPTPPRAPFDFYKDNDSKNTLKIVKRTKYGMSFNVKRGDEILAVLDGGKKINVTNEAQLLNATRGMHGGAKLLVNRSGKKIIVGGNFVPTPAVLNVRGIYFSGILLGVLEHAEYEQLVGIEHPLNIEFIEGGSLAESKGFERSDLITAINGVECNSLNEAFELLQKARDNGDGSVILRIQRPSFAAGRVFTYYERDVKLEDLKWINVNGN